MNLQGSTLNQTSVFVTAGDSNTASQRGVADDAIKASILRTLNWYSHTPVEDVTVDVKYGYVELMGQVQWLYQKMVIAAMVQKVDGVRGIINGIVAANRLNPTLAH